MISRRYVIVVLDNFNPKNFMATANFATTERIFNKFMSNG